MRKLVEEMVKRVPVATVAKEEALVPGGDIRTKGNEWLRAAFQASGLARVPREAQMRLGTTALVKVKKLCAWLALCLLILPLKIVF